MTPGKPATDTQEPTVSNELERVLERLRKAAKTADRQPDAVQREALSQEAAKRRQRDVGDMQVLLKSPECRRVLYRVIEETRAFSGSFVPGKSDLTAYNEGLRAAGMFLVSLADEADPGICLRMAREAKSDAMAAAERARKILEGA